MSPAKIFYSYAREDEGQLNKLRNHLADPRRRKVISDWHDRQIRAGEKWDGKIDEHLRRADLIVFLVSDDFMGSEYVNDVEVKLAIERHQAGEAKVIPVILSPVLWEESVFGGLQALPTDGKPVSTWTDPDEAFLDIARGILKAVEGEREEEESPTAPAPRRRKRGYAVPSLLVMAACLTLGWLFLKYREPPPRPGLAVLPLRNPTNDQSFFAESMTETLISCIASELQGVRVISRQSVNRFKGSNTTVS